MLNPKAPHAQATDWQRVGARVAEFRAERGLTQERLGALAGLGKNRVTRLEGGEPVGEEYLAAVANALGVSLAYLRYGVVTGPDEEALQQLGFRRGVEAALAEIRNWLDAQAGALRIREEAPVVQHQPVIRIPPPAAEKPASRRKRGTA